MGGKVLARACECVFALRAYLRVRERVCVCVCACVHVRLRVRVCLSARAPFATIMMT